MQGAYCSGEGGGEPLLSDPGSQLRLKGAEKRRAKVTNGMGGKTKHKTQNT